MELLLAHLLDSENTVVVSRRSVDCVIWANGLMYVFSTFISMMVSVFDFLPLKFNGAQKINGLRQRLKGSSCDLGGGRVHFVDYRH